MWRFETPKMIISETKKIKAIQKKLWALFAHGPWAAALLAPPFEPALAASCVLWLNLADLDAPTQALKTGERNTSYVDAVMTVPLKAMLPISGINVAFNRELM